MRKLTTTLCAALFVGTASFAAEVNEEKLPDDGRICHEYVFEYVIDSQETVSGQVVETVLVWTVETCIIY